MLGPARICQKQGQNEHSCFQKNNSDKLFEVSLGSYEGFISEQRDRRLTTPLRCCIHYSMKHKHKGGINGAFRETDSDLPAPKPF